MQARTAVALALTGTILVASGAVAQERVRVERRAPAQLDVEREIGRVRSMAMTLGRRARLGVMVDMTAQDDDKFGATIDAVTPGGAAAKAGLRAGDVITAIDGKSLISGDQPKDVEDDSSIPGLRLIEIAAKLEPNDTVDVAYRRGGDAKTTRLVTEGGESDNFFTMRDPGEVRTFTFRGPPGAPGAPGAPRAPRAPLPPDLAGVSPEMLRSIDVMREAGGPSRVNIFLRGGISDLELAPLNADLGRYFGTTEGVLVLNTPKEEGVGLKGGDVVLTIDGRKVTNAAQLQRILRTYEQGEAIKFELQRDRKRETIVGKVPERKTVRWTPEFRTREDDK